VKLGLISKRNRDKSVLHAWNISTGNFVLLRGKIPSTIASRPALRSTQPHI